MPWVIAEPGLNGPKSYNEGRTTYLCDWPHCTSTAEEVVGFVADIAVCAALCRDHARKLRSS